MVPLQALRTSIIPEFLSSNILGHNRQLFLKSSHMFLDVGKQEMDSSYVLDRRSADLDITMYQCCGHKQLQTIVSISSSLEKKYVVSK